MGAGASSCREARPSVVAARASAVVRRPVGPVGPAGPVRPAGPVGPAGIGVRGPGCVMDPGQMVGTERMQELMDDGVGQFVPHLASGSQCPHPAGVAQQGEGVRGGRVERARRAGHVRAAHPGVGVQAEQDPQAALVREEGHALGELRDPARGGEQSRELGDDLLVVRGVVDAHVRGRDGAHVGHRTGPAPVPGLDDSRTVRYGVVTRTDHLVTT